MEELLICTLDADLLGCALDAGVLECTLDADLLGCALDSYDESHPIYKLLLDFMAKASGDYL